MKSNGIFYKILITLLLASTLFISVGAISLTNEKVLAATPNPERILPISTLESYELSSPVNVYADDKIVAIIQGDNSLVVYKDGNFTRPTGANKNFTSLKQVKKFSENELIVSDNGSVYRVNVNTLNVSLLTFGTELIGCTSFDFNGKYLVTSYGVKAFFYEVDSGNIVSMPFTPLESVTDTTIAVNDTSVFYVSNNKLYSRDFIDFDVVNEVYSVAPSKIVATNEYLFYILDGRIYRLALDGSGTDLLTFPDSDYDLGKVTTPTDLTIYRGNVLVTDKENDCVQEFKIEGEKLTYTGFAIAKGKTAYNRIANAKSVEKFGETVAVLQDYKITLLNANTTDYETSSYKNLRVGKAPDFFAFSGKNVFGANKNGDAFILDVNTEEEIAVSLTETVKDVCFRCDYYYALTTTSSSSTVSKINYITGEIVSTVTYNQVFNALEVDVFNNYYLTNAQNIYKDDGSGLTPYATSYGATKMITDLAGELYICNGSSIFTIVFNGINIYPYEWDIGITSVKDFAISIDEGSAYVIKNGEEYLYKTFDLKNVAISSIKTPQDFALSGNSSSLDNLKTFTAKESANLFSVSLSNGGFTYNDLANAETNYLFIDDITVNGKLTVYVLANLDGMVIANEKDCVEETLTFSSAPPKAYTTTTVHAYYLPLITMDMEYALSKGDEKVLLAKHSEIMPEQTFTLFDVLFYFAKITVDGEVKTCYVPANFTVEVLAVDKPFDSFVIKTVKPTTVYSNQELTDKIIELEKTEVRVYEDDGKVAKIKYLEGEVWKDGYVNSSSIINKGKDSVRNVLILLAVITSLCGTASFFILRKK